MHLHIAVMENVGGKIAQPRMESAHSIRWNRQMSENKTVDPCLYILMRSDLASLNPGKACAQATHAANQCVHNIRHADDINARSLLRNWEGPRGFGTCIVLHNTMDAIRTTIGETKNAGIIAGIIHDPSYPIRDGEVTHEIPLDTCAYVFGDRDVLAEFLGDFDLMP